MKKKIAVVGCAWSAYFVKDFLKGVQKALTDKEADIYYFNAYDYTEFSGYINSTGYAAYNLIHYEDYDGFIILSDLISNVRILEKLKQKIILSKKPAIAINKSIEGISCLKIDNYTGFYEIIEHLIKEHKLTEIAYVGGKENSIDFAERYKAYRTALTDNQMKIDMNMVFSIDRCDFNEAYTFISDYISEGKKLPQAFVCANDLIALAILKVCNEHSIEVPKDLKIVGYDDIIYGRTTVPAITTVKSNAQEVGTEAVKRLFSENQEVINLKVKSKVIIRGSCGCEENIKDNQKMFSIDCLSSASDTQSFQKQMETIQEVFTDAPDVFTLLTNLEVFFNKSHHFEGSDFCIFLKSDWSSVLINSVENLPQNWSFGEQVQSIVSIQGNKKYAREVIPTRTLIPSKMQSDENNLCIILPIYNHSYVHGYFVCKNNMEILTNNYGYTWTRTFGTSIERFRKQNMFKQMSQQYLKLSTRDALSGALNRVGLEKLAIPLYEKNKKSGITSVIFFVDINRMKHINDNFGHLHGDLAVKTISAATMEIIPKNWLCIRYGGDEFLVLGSSKDYKGEDYCTMIENRVKQKAAVMKLPYDLSASVGTLSILPNSPLSLEQAVEKVDEIMYEKKQKYHQEHPEIK